MNDQRNRLTVANLDRVDRRVKKVEWPTFLSELHRLGLGEAARVREPMVDLDESIEPREILEGRNPGELSLPVERFQRVLPGLAWLQSTQMRWARMRDRLRMRFDGIDLLPPTI